jgi:hypothetical protein
VQGKPCGIIPFIFEECSDPLAVIGRAAGDKIALITAANPGWRDLYEDILG